MLYPVTTSEYCPYTFIGGHAAATKVHSMADAGQEFYYHEHRWESYGEAHAHEINEMIEMIINNRLTCTLEYNTNSAETDEDGSPLVDVNWVRFVKGQVTDESVCVVE